MFADVLLPLPLDGLFTYSVPTDLEEQVKLFVRVVVPFGARKTYIGLVARLHDDEPQGYTVKNLLRVLDAQPLLLPQQYQLWQWVADYYMSPIGEVYKAALPGGLKAVDGYKPKTETCLRLTPPFRSQQAQHIALDMLRNAPRQLKAFTDFLENPDAPLSQPALSQLVKRGILETYEVEVGRLNHGGEPHPEHIKQLSQAQQQAYNEILFSFLKKDVTLLHGVTSSGKTEIYIHLIQREIDQQRQVLYLLPEIALTVQMMERLRRVFGNRLGIYHSKYSDAERVEIWQKQLSTHPYDIILGARSAVFLPFQRLGLVIVDEEHETSFKQQDPVPRYHARSVAIMLASLTSEKYRAKGVGLAAATSSPDGTAAASPILYTPHSTLNPRVLLGTATPSLETYYNAQRGKYGLVRLMQRHQDIQLPDIQVVDTKDLQHRKMMHGPFSPLLLARVREALERGEQAILFQNRRGYAPMIECKQCGWVPHCQHCDVTLTLHRQTNQLSCHYCGYTYQVPTVCPNCGCTVLQTVGYGTERIEDQLHDIFPDAHISRMDLDTTRSRHSYERIISDFAAGRTNLLVGTQMISKGLDFDRVSVVGILNADAMLNYPDFRAYEHAYTMMMQVSGRAGRKGRRGLVILQTKQPSLPIMEQVVHNDFEALYHDQMDERLAFRYPPYYRLVYAYLKHRDERLADAASQELGRLLRQWFGARVLGPDKPAVARVKSLVVRKLVLKLETQLSMQEVRRYLALAQQQLCQDRRYTSLQVYFDVDPV